LEFGVSRKCGHKWLVRHAEGGAQALADGSRALHSVPLRTSESHGLGDESVVVSAPLSRRNGEDHRKRKDFRERIQKAEPGGNPSSGGATLALQAAFCSLTFDLLRSRSRLQASEQVTTAFEVVPS